jgi:predicted N-acetyltransferase YhbS
MPDPVPVILLARLAVDSHWHGQGLGGALLRDAALSTPQAADLAGIRAMLLHAISPEAARFYRYFGFQSSPGIETTLTMTLAGLEQASR